MITLVIGILSFLLALIGILFTTNVTELIFLILLGISCLIGWGIIYYGGDWSLINAKMNLNKNGKQGLLLIHRKDKRLKLHFFNANAKKLEIKFSNGKDLENYVVVIGEPFSTLVNSGQGVWYYKQGAMTTSFPEQNLEISDQSPQMSNLLKQTLDFGRLSKPSSQDYGLYTLIAVLVLFLGMLVVGYLVYNNSNLLGTISTQLGQINTSITSLSVPAQSGTIGGNVTITPVNAIP